MKDRTIRFLAALGASLIVLLGAVPALGHPHAWIDITSALRFDAEGRVTAIVEEWLFDPLYSAFVTDGIDQDADTLQKELGALARTNLDNLREYDYFTDVRLGGKRVAVGEVERFETAMHDGRLWMRFTVPLAAPADVRSEWLGYAIYDPTYFVEMLHIKGFEIALTPPDGLACETELTPPSPSAETRRFAFALDRTEEAPDSLGVHFAEWVTVKCEQAGAPPRSSPRWSC